MISIAGLCMGCASFGRQKAPDLSSHLPLGIVTVVSNYNIYWDDEDPGASNSPKKNENPEKTQVSRADTLITDAEAILRQSFSGAGITAVAPKDRITGSQAYANAKRRRVWNNENIVIAEGYEPIDYGDKKFAAALAEETGVKAGIYIAFDFSKAMTSGIGKLSGNFRVQLYMKVIIVDEKGQILYRKNRYVSGDERIRVSRRAFNQNELLDLFRSNIANACYLFIQEFAALNSLDLEK
jgi:secreted trypsin-like serine protease